jgi:M6 family metalloprotease-like protein/MYXO-CTERM domain-containing protein
MAKRKLGAFLATLLGALCLADPAQGLIVWNGKIVPAWPDQAVQVPAGAQLAATNIGLYPDPKGTVYGLTLLIDFSDTAPAFSKTEIDAWLNQQGYTGDGLNGSVRDYFFDQSNGLVDFQNEIFGFYRAQFPKSHYEGGSGYSGSDELFEELMDYFDGQVDFSKYDNDGDGRTEAISIVYAGPAETWGQGLWPHAAGSNQKRDGVTVARYMMTNLGSSLGLYTFSHEVGHMLFGWPDLYGFGNYCIMGNSSSAKNPVGINDLYRADQGWIELVDVTADTNALYSAKVNGAGYRYQNPEDPQEWFFWSNVRSEDRFSTIEGDGLLLLHFDKGIGRNDPPNPLSLAVVQADGKKDLDATMWPNPGSDDADFFHGGGVSEFSEAKFATAKWNDGSASELHIYDIGPASTDMQFKVGNGPIVVDPNGGMGGLAGMGGMTVGGSAGSGGGAGEAGSMSLGGAPQGGVGGASLPGTGGMAGALAMPSAGMAVATGGTDGAAPPGVDGSCACRAAGPDGSLSSAWPAALLGLLLVQRRRRRPAA